MPRQGAAATSNDEGNADIRSDRGSLPRGSKEANLKVPKEKIAVSLDPADIKLESAIVDVETLRTDK